MTKNNENHGQRNEMIRKTIEVIEHVNNISKIKYSYEITSKLWLVYYVFFRSRDCKCQ